jgi:hypothetical protein
VDFLANQVDGFGVGDQGDSHAIGRQGLAGWF